MREQGIHICIVVRVRQWNKLCMYMCNMYHHKVLVQYWLEVGKNYVCMKCWYSTVVRVSYS